MFILIPLLVPAGGLLDFRHTFDVREKLGQAELLQRSKKGLTATATTNAVQQSPPVILIQPTIDGPYGRRTDPTHLRRLDFFFAVQMWAWCSNSAVGAFLE